MVQQFGSTELYCWIARSTYDGLWILDEAGCTSYANDRLAEMLGRSPEEMPGLAAVEHIAVEDRPQFLDLDGLSRARTGHHNLECSLVREDGSRTWALASHTTLLDDEGVRRGWLHRLTEIAEPDRPSAEVATSEQQLAEAQSIAMIGSWDWDLTTNALTWSDELYRVFDFAPQEFVPTYETFMALVHPDDQGMVDATVSAALTEDETFSFDARIIKRGGEDGWIRGRGRVTRDSEGAPARMGGTCQGITDAVVVAKAQAAERDAAMDASRMKSDYLATMSHEIRTPLNGVVGLTDLLLKTVLQPDQERLATGIALAGRTLLTLIHDVLDLSKIEAGKLELEVVDFEIRSVVGQVASLMAEAARVKAVALVVEYDADVPVMLRGDPVRFGQVVTNLVSNATKFTSEGQVTVRVSQAGIGRDSRIIRVQVSDTGIGVRPEAHDTLFESFTQADVSTTREYGGTGLGLTISRRLVDALGGEIGFTSEVGVGSTFWFTAAFRPTRDRHVAELNASVVTSTHPLDLGTVLVVEDNEVNQMVARGVLEGLGYLVQVVPDGLEAVAEVTAGPSRFVAVLMDCRMPRLDGYEATRVIRQLEEIGTRVPVIAMTASTTAGERQRCLDAGMDDLLTKPIDFAELESTLVRWTGSTAPIATHDNSHDKPHLARRTGVIN